ncbi:MAG: glutamate--tRNA ligase [Bacteriovoracaceae bacterium]
MTVRVRFAPSPTGYLHIGGARTALYNYLFAKATGGTFVLRVEDTDLERSSSEYEKLQIEDLKWLGLNHDEGPDKPNPKYGPYRQSERLEIYSKYAQQLIEKGMAYYDFCTEEELEAMKAQNEADGLDPHYTAKWRNEEHWAEAKARVAAGEKTAIRFKVPKKSYELNDKAKGKVVYPENMVGDFVIMRSNGLPTYNYCCVIDDWLMDITHVIRGEDHLNNTVRQLMIYEALGAKLPEFAHVSLLIGADRQKLSKRHGATSVNLYRNDHYLPEAMLNYLCLLGWSHPEEKDVFTKEEIIPLFNLDRFSVHSAIYDLVKLKYINGQHLKAKSNDELIKMVETFCEGPAADHFKKQSPEWKNKLVELARQYSDFVTDITKNLQEMILDPSLESGEQADEIKSWESSLKVFDFMKSKVDSYTGEFIAETDLNAWTETLKKELGIKGKPLFMGSRFALTGKAHGPDLKLLIPLTPVSIIKARQAAIGKFLG